MFVRFKLKIQCMSQDIFTSGIFHESSSTEPIGAITSFLSKIGEDGSQKNLK
jgi:hypothetical protein